MWGRLPLCRTVSDGLSGCPAGWREDRLAADVHDADGWVFEGVSYMTRHQMCEARALRGVFGCGDEFHAGRACGGCLQAYRQGVAQRPDPCHGTQRAAAGGLAFHRAVTGRVFLYGSYRWIDKYGKGISMRVLSSGLGSLAGRPFLILGVALMAVASDVLVPVAWWRADRLLWWVVPGVLWLVGLLLTAVFPPRDAGARTGVVVVVLLGQLVFAVLFGVVAFLSKAEGRYGYLLAALVLVLAAVSLLAVMRDGDVRDAVPPAVMLPFVLFVDRVPAVNWMTIHLPLLLAFMLLLVQAGLVWHALMRLPDQPATAPPVRTRHGK